MKITKLTSENIKRLSVVEITPDGSLVTIGGKNGAGKSSVLDSIAYVLGGEKLVPAQPIRTGESEARIVVDLEDYIVTRRFYREHLACDCEGTMAGSHDPNCASRKFGPTKSVLTVTNREGAKYPAPQVLLDKLYGKLTFDPLAFSKEPAKKQDEILRKLVNLDFTLLDSQRKTFFDRRAMHKKTMQLAEAKLTNMPRHPGAPAAEVPIADISAEIYEGQRLKNEADDKLKDVDQLQRQALNIGAEIELRHRQIADLEKQIAELQKSLAASRVALKDTEDRFEANHKSTELAIAAADDARKKVPDFQALDKRLAEIDTLNRQVRENKAYAEQKAEVRRLGILAEEDTGRIEAVDEQKAKALSAAKFPVEGLGLSDDGVTFEGLSLDQVSASVQLRVSIAIGLALNPTLKVLLIRNGNLLDEDSLKLVAEQAEEAGAQVWMEYVTSSKDGVSVMLEDGHIA